MNRAQDWLYKYPGLAVSLVASIFYGLTLAPDVLMIDTGELAAAIAEPGVAHATGYPLFTVLGWLFLKLPLGLRPIEQANLFALVCTAAGAGVATQVIIRFITLKQDGYDQLTVAIASVFAGLVLALSKVVWFQAVSIEVYGLHLLLVSGVLLALLNAWGKTDLKPWLILAISLALSFGNHMSTVMTAPAILIVYLVTFRFEKTGFTILAKILALFFLLLGVIYSYLFIASSWSPDSNWGYIKDWDSFKYHVTGKQFSVWVFAKGAAGKQIKVFFSSLTGFGLLGLVAVIGSLLWLLVKERAKALWLMLVILGCLVWAINYDIHDIESYFILAYLGLCIGLGYGIYQLSQVAVFKRMAVLAIVFLLVITDEVRMNYREVDYHDDLTFAALTKDVLLNTRPNAIILSKAWDHWLASSFYYQRVEKLRPDVTVIDKELLRRTWYLNWIEEKYPWLYGSRKADMTGFKAALWPFEHDGQYNPEALQGYYLAISSATVSDHFMSRPCYLTPEIYLEDYQDGGYKLPANCMLIPEGFYVRIAPVGTAYQEVRWPENLEKIANRSDLHSRTKYHQQAMYAASVTMMWRADYELANGYAVKAKKWLNLAKKLNPALELTPNLAKMGA